MWCGKKQWKPLSFFYIKPVPQPPKLDNLNVTNQSSSWLFHWCMNLKICNKSLQRVFKSKCTLKNSSETRLRHLFIIARGILRFQPCSKFLYCEMHKARKKIHLAPTYKPPTCISRSLNSPLVVSSKKQALFKLLPTYFTHSLCCSAVELMSMGFTERKLHFERNLVKMRKSA